MIRFKKKPWGELLLLIYAEGYTPTIYICTEIYQDMELQGPTIYMQKQKSDEIQYIFDEPNLYWAKELIKKYTPES